MIKWLWLILLSVLTVNATCYASVTDDTTTNRSSATAAIDSLNGKIYNDYLNNPNRARKMAEDLLLRSKKIHYKKGIGQSFFNIGVTYWAQSYSAISLLYIDTAINYFDKEDHENLSVSYRHIARDYIELRNYPSAQHYLDKAENEADSDPALMEQILGERSILFFRTKQYEKAIGIINSQLKMVTDLNDKAEEAILYGRLSGIYAEYNKPANNALAMHYADTSATLSYRTQNKRLRASCWLTQADLFAQQNKTDIALKYANQALLLADSLGIADMTAKAYKAMMAIYQSKGDIKALLTCQKRYMAFQDAHNRAVIDNSSQLISDHFALNAQIHAIDRASHDAELNNLVVQSQKRTIIILSALLLLLIIALYIVYRYYSQKRKLVENLNQQHQATVTQAQLIEVQSQHLEELNNLKNKLLLVIGHDLRGPIGNLSSLTSMFDDGHLKEDEIVQVMRSISPVIKGAELTLKNLLEWAESQIKGNNMQSACVTLAPVVDEVRNILKYAFDQKNIQFVNQAPADHIAMIDLNHLKVILRNLISNAIKFTPPKGQITVTSHLANNKITISVSDTGRGMTDEEIERLLSAKTHFTKPGTQGEKGTGIGLLLCRELIELNGGELWLTSEVDRGTTFYFNLPCC